MVSCALCASSVRAADYYVSLSGDNSYPGTQERPFRTLAYASRALKSGDTLYIRAGTWSEAMTGTAGFVFQNGTASGYTKYAALKGERVILKPGPGLFVVLIPVTAAYIELSGLEIDATNATSYGVKIDKSGGAAAHHIRIVGNEIKNGHMGIQGGGQSCEILRNHIHHFDGYGIYGGSSYDGSGGLFEGNIIHHCGGHGFHLYESAGAVDNNVVRNNVFYANGFGFFFDGEWRQAPALRSSHGKNNRIYNNVFYGNYAGIYDGLQGTLIANNTLYGSTKYGIQVGGNARVVNNLVWGNKGEQIVDLKGGSTYQTNLSVEPKVINAASADFHLRPDSAARNKGTQVTEVAADKDGVLRPQDSTYDVGAYEFSFVRTPPTPGVPGEFSVQ